MSGPFSRRGATWLALAATASLAAAAFLGVFGDELSEPPSVAPGAYSRSAIGHRAFVTLLRELGIPTLVSRHRTADKAADGALVVLAEPALEPAGERGRRTVTLEEIASDASRLLVVLPKRSGFPDPHRPRWLGGASLLPLAEVRRALEVLELDAEVVRPRQLTAASCGTLPAGAVLDAPQLLRSDALVPLVSYAEGMLAGEVVDEETGRRIVVLADPDVLANHGLGRGENAALALRLVERLGGGEVPVVIDETLHGLDLQPSVARELFRFPLVLATAQAALLAALAVWAGLVRFGRPRPPDALLAPGKAFLVENTAALLRHGGHVAHVLGAYLRAAKDEVARRSRAPGDRAEAQDAWIARLAAARGRSDALARAEARVRALEGRGRGAEEDALRTALEIHTWREEMTHGADGDSRRDRATPR
ncbi:MULTISPECIES: DUF4350 domain-containing protein [Anaeromyxobacter]|uniref:DUF4350 domain-containing protein n=1 Tax=Anaeromyxobacter TaxID=161492 RepID=UPI001F566B3C|nr:MULTISPECIES: DUF4350 domain-containing protein [unclassified Anaeromyxobacter]